MSETTILVIDDDSSIHATVKSRLRAVVDHVLCAGGATAGIRDAILKRPINKVLSVLTKVAYFDGKTGAPDDRWRFWLQLEFKL